MILTCNSCAKKFVVPDNAITASGRMVQCGSCGNKWKQFPIKNTKPQLTSNQTELHPQRNHSMVGGKGLEPMTLSV